MKKQLFIRGDFNDLHDGKISLRNQVWISLLKKEYGEHLDGQNIWLYEKTDRGGKGDPWVFRGVIGRDEAGEYEVSVNEKDFKRLTELSEFKDYTFEDLGAEFNAEHQLLFGPKLNNFEALKLPKAVFSDFSDMKESEYRAIREKDHPKEFIDINLVLFKYDPIGLNFDTNFDEYEGEARRILERYKEAKDEEQLAAIIKQVFIEQFDEKLASRYITTEAYLSMAKEIWAILNPAK